jgi:hypothetical protein
VPSAFIAASFEANRRVLAAHAVRDLAFGEDALQESGPVPLDGPDNARDFGEVDTQADDV